uniref:TraX family protein n=1 Tax=Acidovorax sp. SUPP3334 TaxID=2920881 RepID=UPI00295293B9|nr:TraX family protein [Acidovorax sp. SUPP3334]BDH38329.1 conjugal transfer protein TraX [Acidovorax sp. SUPP3334]
MSMSRHRAKPAPMASPVASASRGCAPFAYSEASLSAAKWLALVLMVIDHSNKYLFEGAVPWMYAVGRISMPLFAFILGYNLARPGMLAGGGYRRLALRLTVFGLLATVPFMQLNKLGGGWWPLNMMFTMLVSVLAAWLFDLRRPVTVIAACLVIAWGGALGEYWWPAIGLSMAVWNYQRHPSRMLIAGFLTCLALLWVVNGNLWALAAVPVLSLLQFWSIKLPRATWFFYVFYPLHLAALWLILFMKG